MVAFPLYFPDEEKPKKNKKQQKAWDRGMKWLRKSDLLSDGDTIASGYEPDTFTYKQPRRFRDLTSFHSFCNRIKPSDSLFSLQLGFDTNSGFGYIPEDDYIKSLSLSERSKVEIEITPYADDPVQQGQVFITFTNGLHKEIKPKTVIKLDSHTSNPDPDILKAIAEETIPFTEDEIEANYPVIPVGNEPEPKHVYKRTDSIRDWLVNNVIPSTLSKILGTLFLAVVSWLFLHFLHVQINF